MTPGDAVRLRFLRSPEAVPLVRPPLLFWIVWGVLTAIATVCLVVRLQYVTFWNATTDARVLLAGVGIASLLTTLGLMVVSPRQRVRPVTLAAVFGLVFFGLMLYLATTPPIDFYPRKIMVVSLALAAMFTAAPFLLWSSWGRWATVPVLLGLIGFSMMPTISTAAGRNLERKIIPTNAYNLVARYYRNELMADASGGGLAYFGDRFLLVAGDGRFYTFQWDENDALRLQSLHHQVPLNLAQFMSDTAATPTHGRIFRSADILVRDRGDSFRLFVAHHYWYADRKCVTVRVSTTEGTYRAFTDSSEAASWKTLYESEPCLPFDGGFNGEQIGGALAELDSKTLLLTVGDHLHDGVNNKDNLPQDPASPYGKTLQIDEETGAASLFTLGHRNSQGLYIDAAGTVWASEHGPKGGDELNILSKGRNYGWPNVTYGTNYFETTWPLNPRQGRHDGFEPPLFAWVPSVGLSSVIGLRHERFARWHGDLLVASMGGHAIWRVRVEHGRAMSTEKIDVGERVRDMIEGPDGRLVLWTEQTNPGPTAGTLVLIEPVPENPDAGGAVVAGLSTVQRGELAFSRCIGCHAVDGTTHGIGPNLRGVMGRDIAGADGFGYSDALKRLPGTWTDEAMNGFLADPTVAAPGTSMQTGGIADADERAALVEYLKTR